MEHTHAVIDSDLRFTIDPKSKNISATPSNLILTQNDHNSERYTFELPRYIDGHDMTQCNRVQIHYENITRNKKSSTLDIYNVNDLDYNPENEEIVTFTWLISGNATRHVGRLNFAIHFECISDNGEIVYSWNTGVFQGVNVIAGLNNTQQIIEQYSDFTTQMEARLDKCITNVNGMTADENGTVVIEAITEDEVRDLLAALEEGAD